MVSLRSSTRGSPCNASAPLLVLAACALAPSLAITISYGDNDQVPPKKYAMWEQRKTQTKRAQSLKSGSVMLTSNSNHHVDASEQARLRDLMQQRYNNNQQKVQASPYTEAGQGGSTARMSLASSRRVSRGEYGGEYGQRRMEVPPLYTSPSKDQLTSVSNRSQSTARKNIDQARSHARLYNTRAVPASNIKSAQKVAPVKEMTLPKAGVYDSDDGNVWKVLPNGQFMLNGKLHPTLNREENQHNKLMTPLEQGQYQTATGKIWTPRPEVDSDSEEEVSREAQNVFALTSLQSKPNKVNSAQSKGCVPQIPMSQLNISSSSESDREDSIKSPVDYLKGLAGKNVKAPTVGKKFGQSDVNVQFDVTPYAEDQGVKSVRVTNNAILKQFKLPTDQRFFVKQKLNKNTEWKLFRSEIDAKQNANEVTTLYSKKDFKEFRFNEPEHRNNNDDLYQAGVYSPNEYDETRRNTISSSDE